MSTLSKSDIEKRLKSDFVVTPILTRKQIGDSSIDLRLGNQFIVFRTHTASIFNAYRLAERELRRMQERQVVRFGHKFVLHPGIVVLASTFEYIKMPADLEGQVEGRSSWARLGLLIATASTVEPGFAGVITLEFSNVGTMPLELYPGVRIAQLIIRELSTEVKDAYGKSRKYTNPVGPEFSRLSQDKDAKAFMTEMTEN